MRPTIAIDFDGVIHSYGGGASSEVVPDNPPVPGAREAIEDLSRTHHVIIFTARSPAYVRRWLKEHGFGQMEVTDVKPPEARAFVDDRALTFTGDWPAMVERVRTFKPYWEA